MKASAARAAERFRRVIEATAARSSSSDGPESFLRAEKNELSLRTCALMADVRIPVPTAFVSTIASPALAPTLRRRRERRTRPVTAMP